MLSPADLHQARPFADDVAISGWAKDSVHFMAANQIIDGVGNNTFAPKNVTTEEQATGYANATREQALLIAVRMVKKSGRLTDVTSLRRQRHHHPVRQNRPRHSGHNADASEMTIGRLAN